MSIQFRDVPQVPPVIAHARVRLPKSRLECLIAGQRDVLCDKLGPHAVQRAITSDLHVTINGSLTMSWHEFAASNADALDEDTLADIVAELRRDGRYVGGGGAAPHFTLTLADRS